VKALLSNWIVLGLLGMLTYLGTTFALLRNLGLPSAAAAEPDPAHVVNTTGPSWEFSNPELDQLIADLRREREQVAERGQQLDELAARLQAEQAELARATNLVLRLQREFDQSVTRLQEDEQANLRRLAKLYTTMASDAAAQVMRELPDDTLVKLFAIMKEAEIAPFLELLSKPGPADLKRVAALMDRYRLLQTRAGVTNRPPGP